MSIPRPSFDFSANLLKAVLAVAFLTSALIGSYIAVTDSYLWAQAPTHADGLIAFVILDFLAVAGIYVLPRVIPILAMLLPTVQLAAMAGDLYMGLGSPGSVVQGAFHEYLLNDTAFMTLLVVQAVLAGLAFGNLLRPGYDARVGRDAGLDSVKKADRSANRPAIGRALIGAVVVGVIIVAGAGVYLATTSTATSATSTSSSQYSGPPALQVSIYDGAASSANPPGYAPDGITLVIGVNNTVTWTNNDSIHHTVTSTSAPSGASFSSGSMDGGATYTHTFTVLGTYRYD